jgi:predicted O-methyltransferase YrrM
VELIDMRHFTFTLALVLLFVFAPATLGQRGPRGLRGGSRVETMPAANSDAERRVLEEIEKARATTEHLNVPTTDGRLLRLLTEAAGAKNVVEIGTSTGISGLWLCLALQKTGGKLTTFEYDSGRAATARQHFKAAGVDSLVTVVEGDAHQTVSRLTAPVDLAFIDADKEGYADYLNKLLPLVRPGGLILAHNVGQADAYVQQVAANPALETLFYMEGGGMSLTLKKR